MFAGCLQIMWAHSHLIRAEGSDIRKIIRAENTDVCRSCDLCLQAATDSEVAIAEYLTAIIDDGDSALLAAALGDIARARGMSEIARSAGLTREALYKALRPNAHPRFDTISKVCKALGVKLNVEAI